MFYKTFSDFIHQYFPDQKIQKIMVDARFTCPNRDGKVGWGGCTYCRNDAFSPPYCSLDISVTEQILRGKMFFKDKYTQAKFLVYFQTYSNTYASLPVLQSLFEEALAVKDVVGLVIGTRPDCVDESILDYLQFLSERHFILVEYGVESCHDSTLCRINRGHDYQCAVNAVTETAKRGIFVGVHMILGLPGECEEDILRQPIELSKLPVSLVKLHQIQVLKDTPMETEWIKSPGDFHYMDYNAYVDLLAKYILMLPEDVFVERFASQVPLNLLVAPRWGVKALKLQSDVDKMISTLIYK